MSYCLACLWWYYCGLIKRSKNKQSNFIDNYSLENQSVFSQALKTLYFIYTTLMTVGYGDYLPTNEYEMGFIIIIVLTGPS